MRNTFVSNISEHILRLKRSTRLMMKNAIDNIKPAPSIKCKIMDFFISGHFVNKFMKFFENTAGGNLQKSNEIHEQFCGIRKLY